MDDLTDKAKQETQHLLWKGDWGFYRPDHQRGLNTVLPTVLDLLGTPQKNFPTMTRFLPEATPRDSKRALVMLVDALGYKEFASGERFPALYQKYGTWVTSVFPTITSCAVTSLVQGLTPARHGITGHEIWKDAPGAVIDMLRMCALGEETDLVKQGFDLDQWRRETGVLQTKGAKDLPGTNLLPYRFVNSGLSIYAYDHGSRLGFVDHPEGMVKAGNLLTEMERGWVSLYNGQIDALSHVLGGEHSVVQLAVRQIEQSITWLADSLPPAVARETLLVVVADHGQNTTQHFLPLHGEPEAWLAAHSKAIGYSGRVMHVYLGDHPAEPVRDYLQNFLVGNGLVLDYEEAAPLTGEEREEPFVRQSLGDLVVLLREDWNWEKRPPDPLKSPHESRLVSQHGSLGWDELFVPLLAAPLSAMGSR